MSSRKAAAQNGEAIPSKRTLLDELDASSGSGSGSGSGSEDDQEEGGVTLGPSQGLKINEEYARRFEHNKKREELHRLEEKYSNKKQKKTDGDAEGGDGKEGADSSDEESEDDEGYLVTEELDTEISAVLQAIKNKDPRIYDKDAVFYKPSDPDAEDAAPNEKKEKPVFLQDYHRERYLAGDTGAEADEEEARPKTYLEAQDDLKKSIVSAINAAGADSEEWSEDETFLKPKEKPAADDDVQMTEDGVHPLRAAAAQQQQQQQQQQQLTELDVANADKNPEAYLTKFMAARAWAPEGGSGPSSRWAAFESDDSDDDDKAAAFEHAYNMRFEDPEKSNEVLMSYSRNLTAARSARREELTGRKKQRALEKERKEAEKKQREEERARLRRLKLDEAAEKLAKIKEVAGLSGRTLADEEWMKFLDEAWDDDKWEEEMTRRFGEEYYAEAEAEDLGADGADEDGDEDAENKTKTKTKSKKPKKPKWDDDIDITDIVPDFTDEKAKPDITLSDSEEQEEQKPADEGDEEEDEADSDAERPAKKRKTTTSATSSKSKKQEKLAAKREARQELAKLKALVDQKMELDAPRALAPSSSAPSSSKPAAANGDGNGGERPAFRYRETSPDSFGLTARDILLAPSDAALNQFVGLKKLATFRDADKKRRDRKRLGKKARLREWRRETFGREFEHTGPTFGFGEAPDPPSSAAATTGKSVEMKGKGKTIKGKGKEKEKAKAKAKTGDKGESADRAQQPPPGDDSNVVDGERKKKRKRSKKAGKEAVAVAAS